jgi:cell division protein FtsL
MLNEDMKSIKTINIWLFTILYTAIALSLMHYTEYGIYLVVVYLIYVAQSNSSYQHLNALETSDNIGKLYSRLSDQEKQIANLSDEIERLERNDDSI